MKFFISIFLIFFVVNAGDCQQRGPRAHRSIEAVYKDGKMIDDLARMGLNIRHLKDFEKVRKTPLLRDSLRFLMIHACKMDSIPASISEFYKLEQLRIKNSDIKTLPSSIGELANLNYLELTQNTIEILPKEIFNSDKLNKIVIHGNHLKALPDNFGHQRNLISLDVSHNILESIPASIAKLNNLKSLNLSSNQLESLPNLEGLTELKLLDLSGNKFKELPKDIEELSTLVNLNLSFNCLTSLPSQLDKLGNLESLKCSWNFIQNVYTDFGKLQNLETLHLGNNLLPEVPPSILNTNEDLDHLSLEHNMITSLPLGLASFKDLSTLEIQHNKLEEIPFEILASGISRLNISHNQINRLPEGKIYKMSVFDAKNNLIENLPTSVLNCVDKIDLSNNKIKIIQKLDDCDCKHLNPNVRSFRNNALSNCALSELNLANNQISTIDGLETFKDLYVLDISENNLNSIPIGIDSLIKLRNFNISGNKLPVELDSINKPKEKTSSINLSEKNYKFFSKDELPNLENILNNILTDKHIKFPFSNTLYLELVDGYTTAVLTANHFLNYYHPNNSSFQVVRKNGTMENVIADYYKIEWNPELNEKYLVDEYGGWEIYQASSSSTNSLFIGNGNMYYVFKLDHAGNYDNDERNALGESDFLKFVNSIVIKEN